MSDQQPDLIEVRVLVPAERLASFYDLTARFLEGDVPVATSRRRARRSRRASGPSASSYAPLGQHLRTVEESEATLSFEEVERVIGRPLPQSARDHRAWWANTDTHSQALVWLEAGWRVEAADLSAGVITFLQDGRAA